MTKDGVAPSKGAMRAAHEIMAMMGIACYPERHSYALIIDRETKSPQMEESLEWAMGQIRRPTLIKGQNDAHVAAYERAERLLSELEVKS